MLITTQALADAGLKVNLNKHGLSISGNVPIPEETQAHIDAIANLNRFNPLECDRLREYVCSVTIWQALRNCPTEL